MSMYPQVVSEQMSPYSKGTADFVASEATSSRARDLENKSASAAEIAMYGIPAVAAGIADVFGTSLGILDEGDVQATLDANFQPVGKLYRENEAGVKLTAEIAGSFVPIGIGIKAMRAGSWLAKATDKLTGGNSYVKAIFSTGKSMERLNRPALLRSQQLIKKGQADLSGEGLVADKKLLGLRKKAIAATTSDVFKEGLAADLAIYTMMSDSQLMFPDELSAIENAAMFLVPDAAFAGIANLAQRAVFKRKLVKSGGDLLSRVKNPNDLNQTDIFFQPGIRGVGITLLAQDLQTVKAQLDTTTDSITRTNLQNEITTKRQTLQDQVFQLFNDKYIPGLSHQIKLDGKGNIPAQVKTMTDAIELDAGYLFDATSLETFTAAYRTAFTARKDGLLAGYDTTIADLKTAIADAGVGGDISKLQKKLDTAFEDKDRVLNTFAFVMEPGGSVSRLAERKPIWQDGKRKIKTAKSEFIGKTYEAQLSDDLHGVSAKIVATEDLQLLIPEIKDELVNRINVTKILKSLDEQADPEHSRLLLQDMGKDWHYKTGSQGKVIFTDLRTELQKSIDKWTAVSSSSALRKWIAADDPRALEIYNAYEPVRARLRELADDDGTIPLYRGEAKSETLNPTNDVVSMTSNVKIAQAFGGSVFDNVITRRVPVEDVIMIVGGSGDEFEFIVRGNLQRAKDGINQVTPRAFDALNLMERTAAFGVLQESIDAVKVVGDLNKLAVAPGDHWTRFDSVLQLYEKFGDEVLTRVTLPKGMDTIEAVQFASISAKFRDLQRMLDVKDAASKGALKLKPEQEFSFEDMLKMNNLPGDDSAGIAPLVQLLLDQRVVGDPARLESFMQDMPMLKEAMVKLIQPTDLGKPLNTNLRFKGDMLSIAKDKKPVVLLNHDSLSQPGYITREMLVQQVTAQRINTIEGLKQAGANGATIMALVTEEILGRTDALKQAMRVDLLVNGTQQGSDRFVQGAFINRNNPVMVAVDTLVDLAEKRVLTYMDQRFSQYQGTFSKLLSRANSGDMDSFALARHALGQGWDMLPDPVKLADGKWGLALDPSSAFNTKRYKEVYRVDMPDAELGDIMLPQPITAKNALGAEPEPLAITQLAMDGLVGLVDLGKEVLTNINYARRLQGRAPINMKQWHLPPKDLSGKNLIFLVDDAGQLHSIKSGNSLAEARREADVEIANSDKVLNKFGVEDVGRYFDIQAEAFVRATNMANPRRQDGAATGKSIGSDVELGGEVLSSIIGTLQQQFDSISKETRGILFEPELNFARARQSAAGVSPEQAAKRQTIWDQYQNRIFGTPSLNDKTAIGKTYAAIETVYDTILQRAFDKLTASRGLGGITGTQTAQFNQLQDSLGDFNPYKNINDYVERTTKIRMPQTLRKHAAQLNYITAALALRILDAGMAVINFASLGATIPPVVKMMQRMKGESKQEWEGRTAAWGAPVTDDLAEWSATRATISGLHYAFTKEGSQVWKEAAVRGYVKQEVAERLSAFVAPRQGYVANLLRKSVNAVSILTDRSETFSRGLSYMTGYNLGKNGLKLDHEASLLFAHNFANKVIGDFRPNNRPQMFQGAAGMPLGLFTTFMMNFLQRVYSTVENKQMAAVLNQVGMQFSLFGASSLPGVEGFITTLTSNYDGSVNLVDRLHEGYGADVTSLIMNGTLSTVPLWFGADSGVALNTRANIGLPFSREGGLLANIPAMGTLTAVKDAGAAAINAIKSENGLSLYQASEILQQTATNRATRSALEMYNGYAIDRQGNMIASDINTTAGTVNRLFGFKSTRENEMGKERARTNLTNQTQSEIMSRLTAKFRSSARAGTIGENLNGFLMEYMKSGGKPENFPRVVRDQMFAGTTEKVQRDVLKALSAGNTDGNLSRLLLLLQPGGIEE